MIYMYIYIYEHSTYLTTSLSHCSLQPVSGCRGETDYRLRRISRFHFQDPIDVEGDWNKFLGQLDYGFTCIFAIEVMLKVIILIRHYKLQLQVACLVLQRGNWL